MTRVLLIALLLVEVALAHAVLAGGADGGAPATPTRPAVPTAGEVLHQLTSGNWRERQETIRGLIDLGPDAEPVLHELSLRDLDHETRKDIELVAARIRDDRAFGPTLVTLHVAEAKPGDVFANLAKQCAGALPTWPDKLWTEDNWPKLTLDYDRKPFWDVMADLSKQLQLDYITRDPQEIRISRDSGHPPGGFCAAGAFLVTLEAITFRNGMTVELCVYGEPKLVVTRAASFKLERAEDDQGHLLLPLTSRRMWGRRFRTGSRQLPIMFQRPPDEVTRIGRMKGTVNVVIQTASDTWEVHDPASMSPASRLIDSIPVTIESLTSGRAGGEGYELLITLPANASSRGAQDEIAELIRTRLSLLDGNGHKLSQTMVDTRGTTDGAEITVDFAPAAQADGTRTGPPVRLLWDIPSQTRQWPVPFDFKNVPINDPFN